MTQELLNIRKIVEDEMRRITREMVTEDVAATAQRCLICGTSIPTTEPYYTTPKVCDKCKAAVLKVRKEMEEDDESLRPHWRGEKGASRDDPPGPDIFEKTYERVEDEQPTIEAIPAEKLGKLGELMLPYKGCPRGQMGRMGGATLEEEAFYMGVITDEDGGRWVPVNEDVLRELVEKAKERPHGRWEFFDFASPTVECSICGALAGWNVAEEYHSDRTNFCPNCGAKMDEN